jgi:hypothetical protein
MNVKKATISPCEALKCTCASRFALSGSAAMPLLGFGVGGAFSTGFGRVPMISDAGVKISPLSIMKLGEVERGLKE